MQAVGIDIGGTTTRLGLVDETGQVQQSRKFTTPVASGTDWIELLDRERALLLAAARKARILEEEPRATGIAVAGIIDREAGTVERAVNLPNIEGVPLVQPLAERWGTVLLLTDAEAATYAEYVAADEQPGSFVHLRLGTGVAVGFVVDGVHQPPARPRPDAHPTLLLVDFRPSARVCPCGMRGCLEVYAGGRVLEQAAKSMGIDGGLVELEAAFGRDELAPQLINETAAYLAAALRRLTIEGGAERICVGGGVIEALPSLLESCREQLAGIADQEPGVARPVLVPTRCGDDAGIIGVAALAAVCS